DRMLGVPPSATFDERFGGATTPLKLLGGGVPGLNGPYAPMTAQGRRAAATWADQLSGEPSTNIEDRRQLSEDNTDALTLNTEELKRLNDFLLGESLAPDGQRYGLLGGALGGRAGIGGGIGGGGGLGGGGGGGGAYGNDSGPGTGAGAGATPA